MRTDKQLRAITAACDVFIRYGFARTTMADLAKAAGMSRPALYLIYPNKEEIFVAVVEWMSERNLVAIRESMDDGWPLARKLIHALEISVVQGYDAIKANPDAEDLFALSSNMPALAACYAVLQDYLVDLLRDAVAQSALGVTPEELGRALLLAIKGFKLAAVDTQDLRRLIGLQVTLMTAALRESA